MHTLIHMQLSYRMFIDTEGTAYIVFPYYGG